MSDQIQVGDRVMVRWDGTFREATVLSISKPEGFIGTAKVRWCSRGRSESKNDFTRTYEFFLDKLTSLVKNRP